MLHIFIRRESGDIENGEVIDSEDLLMHLDHLESILIDGDVVVNAA